MIPKVTRSWLSRCIRAPVWQYGDVPAMLTSSSADTKLRFQALKNRGLSCLFVAIQAPVRFSCLYVISFTSESELERVLGIRSIGEAKNEE